MSYTQRQRRATLLERLGAAFDDADGDARGPQLTGYQVHRIPRLLPKDGSVHQLLWALDEIRRYNRWLKYGVKFETVPERNWMAERGIGNVQSKLKYPYGDDWQEGYDARRKERAAKREAATTGNGRGAHTQLRAVRAAGRHSARRHVLSTGRSRAKRARSYRVR
jgi:hypothetical protein